MSAHPVHLDARVQEHPRGADHVHDDGRVHRVASENYAARPHPEFVVLDIGGDVGALIVHTDPDLHGTEVEISRTGEDDRRAHKDVLERDMGGRRAFTAVFDDLPAGGYTLWSGGEARVRGVQISGGEIRELDWTGAHASD